MLRKLAVAAGLTTVLSMGAVAQDAKTVIADATKAMGAENMSSVIYSGSAARTGNFGQSKTIAGPLAVTTITNYSRAIDLTQPGVARDGNDDAADDPRRAGAASRVLQSEHHAGQYGVDAAARNLGDALGIPEGRRGKQRHGSLPADRRKAYNVVTWSPAQKAPSGQPYRLTGYIDDKNMVDRVETWVEHPVVGDLHVDTTYANYQDFDGLKVPTKIVQKRAGLADLRSDDHERAARIQPTSPSC